LRSYANKGKIVTIRNAANQRLYDVESFVGERSEPATICYCRVSSGKQKDDLARQVVYMREQFPNAEIIKDIGSGLNFKRKGIKTLLDRLLRGDKLTLVVAHRDRLARFGFELFEYMVDENGGEILVLDRTEASPEEEVTRDILQILHVFSCRVNGLRRYHNEIKKDKSLPNS
jgi:predicted site-specific integrase-resolvase